MRSATLFTAVAALLLGSVVSMAAQESLTSKGRVVIPEAAIERPGDVGVRAHLPLRIFVPADRAKYAGDPNSYALPAAAARNVVGPPFPNTGVNTPASIACQYHLVTTAAGCNPNTFKTNPTGGSKTIALVDAGDYPTAMADLNAFSTQFGLPLVTSSTFKTFFASAGGGCTGTDPGFNADHEIETALDIEWAHAMAPKAKIIVVFSQSLALSDLLNAEDCASKQVAAAGGGEISNSWGGSEFSSEASDDSHFTKAGIVYFASTGDSAGTQWPSTSPNVVAVGGTTVSRVNSGATLGNFIGEFAWEDGGGGLSQYEARPSYQSVLPSATHRQVPDVSAVANPNTPVWVYDNNPTYGCCWFLVGGTSAASPTWAGIVNAAGHFAASSKAELTTIYTDYGTAATYAADFNDITVGFCSFYDGTLAAVKYDQCTGVGSPKTYVGK